MIGISVFVAGVVLGQAADPLKLTFEKTNWEETGSYAEAVAFCRELDRRSDNVKVVKYGVSPQGRDMVAMVVSKNPDAVIDGAPGRNRPVVFVQNGIHSGEIEGKDATLWLTREMVLGTSDEFKELYDEVDLVILPVFSVDAHERKSAFNRINQNGPTEMGWRSTAENYNLNRDYAKVDSKEMQALIPFLNQVDPDFLIDNHTTDGGDWQYVVQYDVPRSPTMDSGIVDWSIKYVNGVMPQVDEAGYLTAQYFGNINHRAEVPTVRINDFGPRYSTGYSAMRDIPSLLVETHVLKDYKTRWEATVELNYRTWEWIGKTGDELLAARQGAVAKAKTRKEGDEVIISSRNAGVRKDWVFKGYEFTPYMSEISGGEIPAWDLTKPVDKPAILMDEFVPAQKVVLPAAYLVPQEWREVIKRLELHGVEMERVREDSQLGREVLKLTGATFGSRPYEGRFLPRFGTEKVERVVKIREGDCLVPVDQRLGRLVVQLMEPAASDSFVRWGFFNPVFQEVEYAEAYAMEPYARAMLKDPVLKAEFEEALKDEEFAKNPSARLRWFYERSPYFDQKLGIYPVLRLSGEEYNLLQ